MTPEFTERQPWCTKIGRPLNMAIIDLSETYPALKGGTLTPSILPYPFDGEGIPFKRPALIVVPGGAYAMTSKREGLPIANQFLARGFQTFVLNYVCSPDAVYPEQLKELACAVDYVKKHADEYWVNPDEIFVIGFSAGGHLVGDLAMEEKTIAEDYDLDIDCKVKAIALLYPVISHVFGHCASHTNLLNGLENKDDLLQKLSLHEHVHEGQAPAFIAASIEDEIVPVENSLQYAAALKARKIPFELHLFPFGWHGFSTASNEINPGQNNALLGENMKNWPKMCANFFKGFCVEDLD